MDPEWFCTTVPVASFSRMDGLGCTGGAKPGFLSDERAQQVAVADDAEQELTIQLVPEALVIGRVNLATTDGTDKLQVELFRRTVQNGREVGSQPGMCRQERMENFDLRTYPREVTRYLRRKRSTVIR